MNKKWKWIEWIEFIRAYGGAKHRVRRTEQALEFLRAYAPGRFIALMAENWAAQP